MTLSMAGSRHIPVCVDGVLLPPLARLGGGWAGSHELSPAATCLRRERGSGSDGRRFVAGYVIRGGCKTPLGFVSICRFDPGCAAGACDPGLHCGTPLAFLLVTGANDFVWMQQRRS